MVLAVSIWVCPARAGQGMSGVIAAPLTESASDTVAAELSANSREVVRLAQSGVEEEVLLAYVESVSSPFSVSADDIIFLKDLGISGTVISEMLRHDTSLREQAGPPATTAGTNQFVYDQKLFPGSTKPPEAALTPAIPTPVYVTNAPAPVVTFYEPLQPYGNWIELEGYGWGWQPHAVVIEREWQPYCHGGHWIDTDAGWYWQSDYSWGWMVFHYGRWRRHARWGWVWFPDLVWGPAWVTWRYSGSHFGWAPLPPGAHFVAGEGFRFHNARVGIGFDFGLGPDVFTFVELGHFADRHPHLHRVPGPRVREVYNQTTIVNNYFVGRNNTIVNGGISAERLPAATRNQIRKVEIHDQVDARPSGSRLERVERSGSSLVIERPKLPQARPVQKVVAQKVDDQHPPVRTPVSRVTPPRTTAPKEMTRPEMGRPAQRPSSTYERPAPAPPRTELPAALPGGAARQPAKMPSSPPSSAAPRSAPAGTPPSAVNRPPVQTPLPRKEWIYRAPAPLKPEYSPPRSSPSRALPSPPVFKPQQRGSRSPAVREEK